VFSFSIDKTSCNGESLIKVEVSLDVLVFSAVIVFLIGVGISPFTGSLTGVAFSVFAVSLIGAIISTSDSPAP